MIRRRVIVKRLVEVFLRDGLPYENLPTAEDVEYNRIR